MTALTEALEQLPAYQRASAALSLVEDRRRELDTGRDVEIATRAIIDETIGAVLDDGDPLPADLGKALIHPRQQAEADFAEFQCLDMLADAARHRRDNLLRDHRDHVFAYLSDQLDELLAEVARADRAAGAATDPASAMRAGDDAVQAWRTLEAAVARYDDLRDAQHTAIRDGKVFKGQPGHATDWFGRAGIIANLVEVWPDGAHPDLLTDPDAPGGRRRMQDPPWPAPVWPVARGSRIYTWPTNDRIAYLRWLATTDEVQPWVPSTAELLATVDAIHQAAQDAAPPRDISPQPAQIKA